MIIRYTKKKNNWYNKNKIDSDECSNCGNNGKVVDHVIPLVLSNNDNKENLQWLCKKCNSKKTGFDNKIIWYFKKLGLLVPYSRFEFELKLELNSARNLYLALFKECLKHE